MIDKIHFSLLASWLSLLMRKVISDSQSKLLQHYAKIWVKEKLVLGFLNMHIPCQMCHMEECYACWIILFSAVIIKMLCSGLIKRARCHFPLKSYITLKHFIFCHMVNWIIIKVFRRMQLYQYSHFDMLLKLCKNLNFMYYWSSNKIFFSERERERERREWDKNVWIWCLF